MKMRPRPPAHGHGRATHATRAKPAGGSKFIGPARQLSEMGGLRARAECDVCVVPGPGPMSRLSSDVKFPSVKDKSYVTVKTLL